MSSLYKSHLVSIPLVLLMALVSFNCGSGKGTVKKDPGPKKTVKKSVKKTVVRSKLKYLEGVDHTAQDAFREGVWAINKIPPDYQTAVAKFKAAIDADSKFLEAYLNLGNTYERMGKSDLAIATYQRLRTVLPKAGDADAYIGRIYLARGKLAEAKALFEKILQADPNHVEAKNNLAIYYRLKKDLKTAEKYIKEVLLVRPQNVMALNHLGIIYSIRKKWALALYILRDKVLSIEPNNSEAWTNLGQVYRHFKMLPEAVASFQAAVKINPNNIPARMNLGAIFLKYLHYPAAFKHYKFIIEKEPDNVEARIGYGSSLWGMSKPKDAAKHYKLALAKNPQHKILLLRLGKMYELTLNDSKMAISYYKRWVAVANPPANHVVRMKLKLLGKMKKKLTPKKPAPKKTPEKKTPEKKTPEKKPVKKKG